MNTRDPCLSAVAGILRMSPATMTWAVKHRQNLLRVAAEAAALSSCKIGAKKVTGPSNPFSPLAAVAVPRCSDTSVSVTFSPVRHT